MYLAVSQNRPTAAKYGIHFIVSHPRELDSLPFG